jgi:hypothetical protein
MDGTGATENVTAPRYTCSQSVTFPAGSTSSQTQTIPPVGISTDLWWSSVPDETCYRNQTGVATPSTSPSRLRVPTLVPVFTTPSPVTVTAIPFAQLLTAPPTSAPQPQPAAAPTLGAVFITPRPTTSTVVVAPAPAPVKLMTLSPITPPLSSTALPGAAMVSPPALAPTASIPGDIAAPDVSTVRDITSTTSSDSGVSVATVAGAAGATAGVLVIAGAIFFLFLWRKSNGLSASKLALATNAANPEHGGVTGHDNTETEGDNGHPGGATRPIYHSNSLSRDDEVETDVGHQQQHYVRRIHQYIQQPHPYAAPPSPTAHQHASVHHPPRQQLGGTGPTNPRLVDFKDQVRNVSFDVPRTNNAPPMVEAVAVPVASNRLDPDGRRVV